MGCLSGAARVVLFITVLAVCFPGAVDAQTIPSAPTNLTASAVASTFQINLSWADTSTNEDGFKVERSLDGTNFTQIVQVLPNTTDYLNTGLFPNKTYYYRVRAYNSGGNSAFSGVASTNVLALCPTSAVGWGDNSLGATTPPADLAGLVAISGGYEFSLALKSNGSVVGWGYNDDGEAPPSGGPSGLVAISAGGYHSLGLQSDGTVVGWGANWYGQAAPPAGASNAVGVAAGYLHSVALKSDGTVVSWGYDSDGETNVRTRSDRRGGRRRRSLS